MAVLLELLHVIPISAKAVYATIGPRELQVIFGLTDALVPFEPGVKAIGVLSMCAQGIVAFSGGEALLELPPMNVVFGLMRHIQTTGQQ